MTAPARRSLRNRSVALGQIDLFRSARELKLLSGEATTLTSAVPCPER
jgi:hypothetical protein